LRFHGKGKVNRHLVAVEVRVERGTNQGMKLDRLTFYQDRLESLDSQTVKCRRTVQHNRMFFDNVLKDIPYFRLQLLNHFLRVLDVMGGSVGNQFLHNKGLEQLDRHLFRQTALINLKFRTDYDNRTSGVINTFAQKVLTETAALTFQHIGKRIQGSVSGACYRTAAAAVVDQGVQSLVKHTFLVAHDDIRRSKLQKSLQTIVSVDDPSVQVVQVGSGETSAVQLHHRTKVRGNHRDRRHDHPFRTVSGFTEGFHNFQTFYNTGALLAAGVRQLRLQLLRVLIQVDGFQKLHDGFCSHAYPEAVSVGFAGVLVFFFRQDLFVLKSGISRIQYD